MSSGVDQSVVDGSGPDGSRLRGGLRRLSRSWGWFVFFGVLSLVAGVVALVWPGPTLVVLAVVFGAQLVVSGLFRLVAAVAYHDAGGGVRALMAVLGLLGLVVGLYALRHVALTVVLLAVLLGIYWIVDGVTELFAAIDHPGLPGRAWAMVGGVLSLLAGLVLLIWPNISVSVLALLTGIWLLVFGAVQIAVAVQLRRLR